MKICRLSSMITILRCPPKDPRNSFSFLAQSTGGSFIGSVLLNYETLMIKAFDKWFCLPRRRNSVECSQAFFLRRDGIPVTCGNLVRMEPASAKGIPSTSEQNPSLPRATSPFTGMKYRDAFERR